MDRGPYSSEIEILYDKIKCCVLTYSKRFQYMQKTDWKALGLLLYQQG